jgi:hypothetical protein
MHPEPCDAYERFSTVSVFRCGEPRKRGDAAESCGYIAKQVGSRAVKTLADREECGNGRVAFAALHRTYVGAVQARGRCQAFLRKPDRLPTACNDTAEGAEQLLAASWHYASQDRCTLCVYSL